MSQASPPKQGNVLRNTLILVGAQVLGTPLTILINAAMGRYLGAEDFGHIYLATTLTAFGFLFVDWGTSGVLPAAIAQDRSRASVLLGASLLWRLVATFVISALLLLGCWLAGYSPRFQVVLSIMLVQSAISAVASACQEVVRGFERADVTAWSKLGFQLLLVVLVIPTLLLGGRLSAVLIVQTLVHSILLVAVWIATRRVTGVAVTFRREEVKPLVVRGTPFLAFSFALALQGNVDAVFLSKLTTAEVVGWQAAAQRLSGALTIPAGALISALYPTLARLHVESPEGFRQTSRQALQGTAILAVPLALCCALYRELGIDLFGEDSFGPASNNLLVLSALIFLVYFSMPLGSALVAAGMQRHWAIAQALCVVVSFSLNPLLIPWFQNNYGNGGIGVCIGAVVSEVCMVTAAIVMAPRGVFDRSVVVSVGKALLAGVAMATCAWLLRAITPFVAAPASLVTYFAVLWLVGGVDRAQLQGVREAVQRKLDKRRA
jgi:O-antigen/teichoic acid export membrane protein